MTLPAVTPRSGVLYVNVALPSGASPAPVRVVKLSPRSISVYLCRFLYEIAPPPPKTVGVAFASKNGSHRDRMPNRGWVRLRVP